MCFTMYTTFPCRYRSLVRTIRDLQRSKLFSGTAPHLEAPIMPVRPVPALVEEEEDPPPQIPLQQSSTLRLSSRRLWKSLQQVLLPHLCLHVIASCSHAVRPLTCLRVARFPSAEDKISHWLKCLLTICVISPVWVYSVRADHIFSLSNNYQFSPI